MVESGFLRERAKVVEEAKEKGERCWMEKDGVVARASSKRRLDELLLFLRLRRLECPLG